MTDFMVGDSVEILYHPNNTLNGRKGKVIFIGASLKQGTNPLENNINVPDPETRLIVEMDDKTIINDIRSVQLRKF